MPPKAVTRHEHTLTPGKVSKNDTFANASKEVGHGPMHALPANMGKEEIPILEGKAMFKKEIRAVKKAQKSEVKKKDVHTGKVRDIQAPPTDSNLVKATPNVKADTTSSPSGGLKASKWTNESCSPTKMTRAVTTSDVNPTSTDGRSDKPSNRSGNSDSQISGTRFPAKGLSASKYADSSTMPSQPSPLKPVTGNATKPAVKSNTKTGVPQPGKALHKSSTKYCYAAKAKAVIPSEKALQSAAPALDAKSQPKVTVSKTASEASKVAIQSTDPSGVVPTIKADNGPIIRSGLASSKYADSTAVNATAAPQETSAKTTSDRSVQIPDEYEPEKTIETVTPKKAAPTTTAARIPEPVAKPANDCHLVPSSTQPAEIPTPQATEGNVTSLAESTIEQDVQPTISTDAYSPVEVSEAASIDAVASLPEPTGSAHNLEPATTDDRNTAKFHPKQVRDRAVSSSGSDGSSGETYPSNSSDTSVDDHDETKHVGFSYNVQHLPDGTAHQDVTHQPPEPPAGELVYYHNGLARPLDLVGFLPTAMQQAYYGPPTAGQPHLWDEYTRHWLMPYDHAQYQFHGQDVQPAYCDGTWDHCEPSAPDGSTQQPFSSGDEPGGNGATYDQYGASILLEAKADMAAGCSGDPPQFTSAGVMIVNGTHIARPQPPRSVEEDLPGAMERPGSAPPCLQAPHNGVISRPASVAGSVQSLPTDMERYALTARIQHEEMIKEFRREQLRLLSVFPVPVAQQDPLQKAPVVCGHCGKRGHKTSRCFKLHPELCPWNRKRKGQMSDKPNKPLSATASNFVPAEAQVPAPVDSAQRAPIVEAGITVEPPAAIEPAFAAESSFNVDSADIVEQAGWVGLSQISQPSPSMADSSVHNGEVPHNVDNAPQGLQIEARGVSSPSSKIRSKKSKMAKKKFVKFEPGQPSNGPGPSTAKSNPWGPKAAPPQGPSNGKGLLPPNGSGSNQGPSNGKGVAPPNGPRPQQGHNWANSRNGVEALAKSMQPPAPSTGTHTGASQPKARAPDDPLQTTPIQVGSSPPTKQSNRPIAAPPVQDVRFKPKRPSPLQNDQTVEPADRPAEGLTTSQVGPSDSKGDTPPDPTTDTTDQAIQTLGPPRKGGPYRRTHTITDPGRKIKVIPAEPVTPPPGTYRHVGPAPVIEEPAATTGRDRGGRRGYKVKVNWA